MPVPGYSKLTRAYHRFTPLEFGVFLLAGLLILIGAIGLVGQLQNKVSSSIPAAGGSLEEGVVGFPRYINPVLASTDADRDMASLIYAGLTKLDANGNIELDLASDMKVSDDGETYTFTIKEAARFHDGHPVRAEDVVYTIHMLQDNRISSPHRADWQGVQVQALSENTVEFELAEPFASFPYNVRVGILPKHQWQEESAKTFPFSGLNTNPVGSGPYQVASIERNNEGIPTQYKLRAADSYPDTPLISTIEMTFYADAAEQQEAYKNKGIESVYGIDPAFAAELEADGKRVVTKPLNRIFAVYFNQSNNDALVSESVRNALAQAIPKQDIIEAVLYGYASPIDGPLPADEQGETKHKDESLADAQAALTAAGWVIENGQRTKDGEVLSITLTTADIDSLRRTAEKIADSWQELGVVTEVSALPVSRLSREVIRTRDYEALLFGQLYNQNRDPYAFWHSDEQDDPGLNLAMYANTEVDSLLTDARQATSGKASQLRQQAAETIAAEQPAVFMYTPEFLYALPKAVKGVKLPPITMPADRFAQIEDWYIKTTKLWNIFADTPETDPPPTTETTTQVTASTSSSTSRSPE